MKKMSNQNFPIWKLVSIEFLITISMIMLLEFIEMSNPYCIIDDPDLLYRVLSILTVSQFRSAQSKLFQT